MDNIISLYKSEHEFEIIFPKRFIEVFYEGFKNDDCVITKHVDFSYDNIRRRKFLDRSVEDITKKVIRKYDFTEYGLKLRANLKSETPFDKFNERKISLARIKYRETFTIDEWKIDFTRLTSILNLTNLKYYVDNLKAANSWDNSFNELEMEAEFCGEELTQEKIDDILNKVIKKTPKFYQRYIKIGIVKSINKRAFTLKQALNKAISLESYLYNDVVHNPDQFYMTDKTDGFRAVASFNGEKLFIVTEMDLIEFDSDIPKILLDGELVEGNFYAFDIIEKGDYNKRLEHLRQLFSDHDFSPYKIFMKNIVDFGNFDIYKDKYPYDIDGLIFMKNTGENYKNMTVYKWKEINKITIDFLVVQYMGKFYLFTGITQKDYLRLGFSKLPNYDDILGNIEYTNNFFPMHFISSRNPTSYLYQGDLDYVDPFIGEFQMCEGKCDKFQWVFVKKREDREIKNYYGNTYNVAARNLELFYNRLSFEDLKNYKRGYFHRKKKPFYKQATAYSSMIKDKIMSLGKGTLLDLAAGRGADMRRYKKYYSEVYAVDIDNDALSELLRRRDNYEGSTKIHVIHANVRDFIGSPTEVTEPFTHNQFDVVLCNFAIHYILKEHDDLITFYNFVFAVLKPGGLFMFTSLDGSKVHELSIKEGEVLKYHIEYVHKDDDIMSNIIKVLLPFSDDLYEENLVDIRKIINTFDKTFTLKSYENFNSDIDSEWMNMFAYVILEKKKIAGGKSSVRYIKEGREIKGKTGEIIILYNRDKFIPIQITNGQSYKLLDEL